MIKPLFQKIVVAINGSDQSLHAAMYAILLAINARLRQFMSLILRLSNS